ncbi:MAG TPA: hypothetical protein PLG05_07265 [Bacteroidales bacterium]|nr:hypothetical protein [Bacteroidales bacterium]
MAIDKNMLDPTLNSYRNMLTDLQNKKISGEDMDKMAEIIARMEQLGNELSDINEFFGIVTKENLFQKFTDYYTKAVTSQYKTPQTAIKSSISNTVSQLKQPQGLVRNVISKFKGNITITDAQNLIRKIKN